jgi:hypothetical protein
VRYTVNFGYNLRLSPRWREGPEDPSPRVSARPLVRLATSVRFDAIGRRQASMGAAQMTEKQAFVPRPPEPLLRQGYYAVLI